MPRVPKNRTVEMPGSDREFELICNQIMVYQLRFRVKIVFTPVFQGDTGLVIVRVGVSFLVVGVRV